MKKTSLRFYEIFIGPIEADKPWGGKKGVEGARRFLDKVYRLYTEENKIKDENNFNLDKMYNQIVKKVTEDILPKEYALGFVKLLNPIAPYITEELWNMLGNNDTIAYEPWPSYDASKIVDETYTMIVQVSGKVRGKIEVSTDTSNEEMETLAKNHENVIKNIEGKEVVKVIVVPKKLVNIVVR